MGYSRLQLKHLQHGILNLLANHATDPKGHKGHLLRHLLAYWPAKHFENLDVGGDPWINPPPNHNVFCEWMDPK